MTRPLWQLATFTAIAACLMLMHQKTGVSSPPQDQRSGFSPPRVKAFTLSNNKPLSSRDPVFRDYAFYYFGPMAEAPNILEIDKPIRLGIDTEFSNASNWGAYEKYYGSSTKLKIIVSTQDTLSEYRIPHRWENYPGAHFFAAMPVFILNESDSLMRIGINNRAALKLEVQKPDGEWVGLEYFQRYRCASGLNHVVLPPGNMAVSKVPIYQGPQAVKMRLRLGEAISNEFPGSIHPEQLERGSAAEAYGLPDEWLRF